MNRHVGRSSTKNRSLAASQRVSTLPTMKMSFLPAISLGLAGCTTATTSTTNPGTTNSAARDQIKKLWVKVMQKLMQKLDEACLEIDKRLLRQPAGEFNVAAARAQEAANRINLGYGALDYKHVPGFASMSRVGEAGCLQIAIEANNGHLVIAADQYSNGLKHHCARCHDGLGASQ